MWTQDSPIVKECFKTGQKKQTALRSHVPYLSSSSLSNAPYKFNPLFKPLHLHKKDSSGEIQTGECQFSIPIKAQHLSHLWCGVVTHKLNWNGIHNSGGVVCEDVLYTRFLLCFSVRAYHRLCRGRCCGRPPPQYFPSWPDPRQGRTGQNLIAWCVSIMWCLYAEDIACLHMKCPICRWFIRSRNRQNIVLSRRFQSPWWLSFFLQDSWWTAFFRGWTRVNIGRNNSLDDSQN